MQSHQSLHPFDPISGEEIQLTVEILQKSFQGVLLRYKRIDIQEPLKHEVVPYIEAERLKKPLPQKPSRIVFALFHRLDSGAFYKALVNSDLGILIYAKELPSHVQVCGLSLSMVIDCKY